MGADVVVEGNTVIIKGVDNLKAAPVMATGFACFCQPGDCRPGSRRRYTG